MMLASIKETSFKQYNSVWKKWWNFCQYQKFNVFYDCVPNVLDFLSFLLDKGASYGSLNAARSAISMLLGSHVGENSEIRRFLKGCSNIKPSTRKYEFTWDPKLVLDYLSSLPINKNCSLRLLTIKLISLLALVTAQRRQTLHLIDIRNIIEINGRIEIKIPDSIKTSGPGRTQPVLVIPKFQNDPKICTFTVLKCYLQKTADLRGQASALFISYKSPYAPVSGQTLSRWIKSVLNKSGINTDIFTAHSTRHAATSAANRAGISLDVIRKTAGWTQNSAVFAKHYNLDLVEDRSTFANAIYNRRED